MDRGAWRATVHGVAESSMTEMTEHATRICWVLIATGEKAMATHSSTHGNPMDGGAW